MLIDPTGYCSCYGYSPASMPWSSWERHLLNCPTTQYISMPSESMGPPPSEPSFFEKIGATVVGIIKSDLNAFQAEASGGLGLGGGAEAIFYGVPASIEVKGVIEGYYSFQGGEFSKGNRRGIVGSGQLGLASYSGGQYKYFNVTGPEPGPNSNDITFGFGLSGYLVIGGSVSIEYNISEAWRGAIAVFEEVWS